MSEMGENADFENRLAAAEARIEEVAADATAARHLAAAGDRDLADLTMRVVDNQRATEANRYAINMLGVQTAERFQHLEAKMDSGFRQVDDRFRQVDDRFRQVDDHFRQVDANFRQVDANFRQVDANFDEVRSKLSETAAGLALIVELLSPGGEQTGGNEN